MQQWTRKQWILFYIVSTSLLFLAVTQAMDVNGGLRVTVMDVGQGDSILIQTPEYHNILIDAGPDVTVVDQLSKQMGFFDKTIDLFILTHPHRDHHGGILDVMQKYNVERVLLTGVDAGDPVYLAFLEAIEEQDIEVWFNQSDRDIQIGTDLYLDILYPFGGQSLVGQEVYNKNNSSIVARLLRRVVGGKRGIFAQVYADDEEEDSSSDGWEALVLLAGDAEQEEEREILLSGQELQAPVLKLGHHGSRTSTSEPYLAAVNPKMAVVSAGADNSFGHPHPETLEKTKHLDVRQTMLEGAIEIVW